MDFAWDRPLSTREILVSTLALLREHIGLLLRVALGPMLVALAVDLAFRAFPPLSLASVPHLFIWMALLGLAETRASVAVWELLHHRTVDPAAVSAQVRSRWPAIVLAYALKWILITFGLVLFLVPGVLLLLRLFAVPLVNVVEGLGVRASFQRSRALARGNRRQLFATLGVIELTVILLFIGAAFAFDNSTDTGHGPVWGNVLSWLLNLVYLAVQAALCAVLYANARIRNEGYAP